VSGRMGCSNRGTDGYGCGYCRRLFRGITTRATNNKSRQNTFEDSESNFLPLRLKTKRQLPHVAPRATYPPSWSCPDWYIPRLGVYYMVAVMIDLKSGVTDCRRRARENSPIRGGIPPPPLRLRSRRSQPSTSNSGSASRFTSHHATRGCPFGCMHPWSLNSSSWRS